MPKTNPIRIYREGAGLSLEEFGRFFGVHKTTVMRWEEGILPAERVIDVERVTGIPRHELRPDLYATTLAPTAEAAE